MRAEWVVLEVNHISKIVFIQDTNHPGNKSITNDADKVFNTIQNNFPNYRLVYKDSQGDWGEIIKSNYWGVEIKPWHGIVWDILKR